MRSHLGYFDDPSKSKFSVTDLFVHNHPPEKLGLLTVIEIEPVLYAIRSLERIQTTLTNTGTRYGDIILVDRERAEHSIPAAKHTITILDAAISALVAETGPD